MKYNDDYYNIPTREIACDLFGMGSNRINRFFNSNVRWLSLKENEDYVRVQDLYLSPWCHRFKFPYMKEHIALYIMLFIKYNRNKHIKHIKYIIEETELWKIFDDIFAFDPNIKFSVCPSKIYETFNLIYSDFRVFSRFAKSMNLVEGVDYMRINLTRISAKINKTTKYYEIKITPTTAVILILSHYFCTRVIFTSEFHSFIERVKNHLKSYGNLYYKVRDMIKKDRGELV